MTVQVTDKDADTLQVTFNVTIVDDVPQAVAMTVRHGGGRHALITHR